MASTDPAKPAALAQIIMAPDRTAIHGKSLFLAGSIDMGEAVDWQTKMTDALSRLLPITILNPRRNDWDSSWKEDISNEQFREQVDWELDTQDAADVIAMYFSPESKAPITLLELGLSARSGKLIIACPKGYWKRGNVQIICERFGIPLVDDLDALIRTVIQRF